jgi:hypothetical protein
VCDITTAFLGSCYFAAAAAGSKSFEVVFGSIHIIRVSAVVVAIKEEEED